MRKSIILAAVLWAVCPIIALAQSDPDWSRREMERMQAEQERFNGQIERQRAEQERFNSQQEREDARLARQRAEQDRRTARNSAGATYATGSATPFSVVDTDNITSDRIMAIFKVATDVCRDVSDPTFDNASSLLSDDEDTLLYFYCTMYALGASGQAAPAKR